MKIPERIWICRHIKEILELTTLKSLSLRVYLCMDSHKILKSICYDGQPCDAQCFELRKVKEEK